MATNKVKIKQQVFGEVTITVTVPIQDVTRLQRLVNEKMEDAGEKARMTLDEARELLVLSQLKELDLQLSAKAEIKIEGVSVARQVSDLQRGLWRYSNLEQYISQQGIIDASEIFEERRVAAVAESLRAKASILASTQEDLERHSQESELTPDQIQFVTPFDTVKPEDEDEPETVELPDEYLALFKFNQE